MSTNTYIKKIAEKLEKLKQKVPQPWEKSAKDLDGLASAADAKAADRSLPNFKVAVGKYKNYALAAGVITGLGALGWCLLSDGDKKAGKTHNVGPEMHH